MGWLELVLIAFGIMVSFHAACMIYHYFRNKEKLKYNYLVGVLLFWGALFLPVMGMDIIPAVKMTPKFF